MENNHQLQINFDLGEIEELNDKIKRHPYNTEITLNDLKEKVIQINDKKSLYYDDSIDFILYPIISDNKNLIQENILKEVYKDPNYIIEHREEIKSKKVNNEIIYNFTGEITKDLNDKALNSNLRYFINYYFVKPLETVEEKREYISKLKTIELPKKYIYGLFDFTEETAPLNLTDKEALGLGFNELEHWSFIIKPRLEKYFNNDGIKEIKAIYDKLAPMEKLKDATPETRAKYKEFFFIDGFLLDKQRQELYYTTPNIKDYESELKYKIDGVSKALEKAEATYKELENNFKAKAREYKGIFESQIEEYITSHYNETHEPKLEYKEINNYYNSLYNLIFYNEITPDDERYNEAKEDIEYIKQLKTSKDPMEKLYYLILEKETYFFNYVWLNKGRINLFKNELERVNQEGTFENYCNSLLKKLLSGKYHRQDLIKIEEKIELDKNKIATYVNEILNELYFTNVSFKEADATAIARYKEIALKINELSQNIANLEKIEKSFNNSYEEQEEARNQKEKLGKELEALKLELKSLNIVEFFKKENGENITTYSKAIISTHNNKAINLEETPTHLIINNGNFKLVRPKGFIVQTMKNKKPFNKTYYLDEFKPKLTNSLANLTRLIIEKASLPRELVNKVKVISFDLQELVNKVNPKATFKDQVSELKVMLQLLRDQSIQNITISNKINKTSEKYTSLSFISDFSIDTSNNKLDITLGEIIANVIRANNDSKIWNYKDLTFDSPEEALINSYIDNMLNMSYNGATRTLKATSLINPIPSFMALIEDKKHFDRNISQPFSNNLNNLRTNSLVNWELLQPGIVKKIKEAKTYETLDNIKIDIKYKEGEQPQKFINRAESKELAELKEQDKIRKLKQKNKK